MRVATRPSQPLAFLLVSLTLLFAGTNAYATDLTGKITNAQGGEPLGKVHIAVVGTQLVAVTANDGTFRIANGPAGEQALQISAVGYRTISVPFKSAAAAPGNPNEVTEFSISLLPDNFQHTEKVVVNADIFQSPEWPAVGDTTLTSSELQQTSTVLVNDPFRSLQALPGVSASSNNDLFAQFSVMGAPYEKVGIYVDDVFVPNLLHSVPGERDAPTLSLLTGGDVADMRLLPVAYPVRYADAAGAAVVIRTREGDPSPPLIHASVGMATSELLGQGAFGPNHKATWLIGARKSYIGYLERYFANSRFSQDGFYDANMKLTYALTPSQTLSLYATGGQLGIHDPNTKVPPGQSFLVDGTSDLAVARLGWKWAASPKLLVDTRAAFVRTGSYQNYVRTTFRGLDREWSIGTNVSWNWGHGAILQTGYSLRRPHVNIAEVVNQPPLPLFVSFRFSDVRQDFYIQNSLPLWQDRIRIEGGLRWSKLNTEREQPVTEQFSVSLKAASNTTFEAGWGRYAQLPGRGGVLGAASVQGVLIGLGNLPYLSSHYIVAAEQRLGERTRLRIEAFDRQNQTRADIFTAPLPPAPFVFTLVACSVTLNRDHSRGLQVLLQRRSENRLSGWIGYTYTQARSRSYQITLPSPVPTFDFDTPYEPTEQDQPHTANVFGSYRLTPSVRLSAKALYGSGFPVTSGLPLSVTGGLPIPRIGPYERIDLRGEKSWTFQRWKLSLYTELLNVTNHDNRRLSAFFVDPVTHKTIVNTGPGLPFIPTAGLGFDF